MKLLGIPVPTPFSIARALLERDRRNVWSCPGRLHIEVHGVHGPGGAKVARRVEKRLAEQPGVIWAKVNAPSSRVIISVDRAARQAELVKIVEKAEAEPDTEEERIAEDELHHPADGATGTRLLPTLAVDAFGLVLSVITKISPWAPLPAEVAGLLSAIDMHPRLRDRLARYMHGNERADTATSMAAAVVHGLAARTESTMLDAAQRVQQWQEAKAHKDAWCKAEGELIKGPEDAAADPVVTERPRPLPDGPIERYAHRALVAGGVAGAVALPFAGPRRAMGLALASLPKAAGMGQTAFAAHLGRMLARRGTLVMDRSALRLIDDVDVLVLDAVALSSDRWLLSDLVPLPGNEPTDLVEHAFELFDPTDPLTVRQNEDWSLGPVDELPIEGRKGARERRKLEDRGAQAVLGLVRGDHLEAVLAVSKEVSPAVHAITAAARETGLRLVTATENLIGTIRQLQGEDHVVMTVSGDRKALGTADIGVGVHEDDDPPPWGAHLLVGNDSDVIVLLIEAIQAARLVNRDGIRFAQAASGIAAVGALNTRQASPAETSLRAVNGGAALAFIDGIWRARQLRGKSQAPDFTQPWHLMPVDMVLEMVRSGSDGLTPDEVKRRRRGSSSQNGTPETGLGSAFLAELANPLTPVLAGGAALSAAVGSPADAALVAGITSVSALIGAVQQVRTERSLAELLSRSAVTTTVLRDNQSVVINADELVSGDVVTLEAGDVVPADCRLMEASGLEVDESSLTGESLPVTKDPAPVVAELAERTSMLYEGTTIAAGRAKAVVVAVGEATEVGRSMAAAHKNTPVTGVEARLAELTRHALPVAIGSAAAVSGAGLLHGVPMRESLGAAVNLAVASVPEGLPFLVSAAQLAAARRLADKNALVRNPRTIEALGRVDVLCFDKTGTLTEGKLSVGQVDSLDNSPDHVLTAALRATPQADNPKDLAHHTDRAVLEGAREAQVEINGWKMVSALQFEPSRGYHATVGKSGGQLVLSVKGAPETILPRCRNRRGMLKRAEKLAAAGHRVLAVAERPIDEKEVTDESVRDLKLLGFVALSDPVRDSAPPAAAQLRDAGVQIVMITGDHPATGEAIASKVNGSTNGESTVVTGSEIDDLGDEQLAELLPRVDVIARCSPGQKVRIIEAYRKMGRIVAMTGDGANDAPAIRLADVGIALGRRGTPAARAAADLVVTDDRLETIIAALIEGRAMWASVREALGILLGGNAGEIAFSVLGSLITGRSPLGARQLLLVNLLTDLAPALAIALSRPDSEAVPDLLREGPSASLGAALGRDITSRAVTTTLGASAAWTAARFTGRSRRASTVALAALVATQLGQTIVTGGTDRTVLAAGLGSAAILGGVIQTPGVSQFFGCTPLGPIGWGIALSSAAAANLASPIVSKLLPSE
ncbi:cation-transporting P-type ATPase [Kibdelosporangium aridum]|uniref:Cation-transporting P-type ATPase n=1 Tax=Kibdelosporangium aridum TaxID=2030 RepID=A0A428YZT2_KIBAR|nr:cation-transporting P-type ATPase [Kibdelosporangium aridum]RSM76957.1 cation-transporting P-type ATPase [Kibdelosporangium aridum]